MIGANRQLRLSVNWSLFPLALFTSASIFAAQDITELQLLRETLREQQKQLEAQQDQIKAQQGQLDRQTAQIERLLAISERPERFEPSLSALPIAPASEQASATVDGAEWIVEPTSSMEMGARDSIGDLNAQAISQGTFRGSIFIPDKDLSMAIGGFVKTLAIVDSDLENTGTAFLPAYLGTGGENSEGATSIDATTSRMYIEAQSKTDMGKLRAYAEMDFNDDNNGTLGPNMRHLYGQWLTDRGTLLAGQTWSTAMDLKILPEGLTEPYLSGAILQRQPQIRWSQNITDTFKYEVAVEDPTSNDATTGDSYRDTTRYPDLIGAAEWNWGRKAHIRVSGLVREIRATGQDGSTAEELAGGISFGAHYEFENSDRITASASFGEGIGRYMLGLPGGQAGFINVEDGDLDLNQATGALITYKRAWDDHLRSYFSFGHAWVDDQDWQDADSFDSSSFGIANLLWSPRDYITLGVELQYGRRENKDGRDFDNTRVLFGIQLF